MYGTIRGFLNISLSNNPAFFGEHFTRVEPLEVIVLCVVSAVNRVYFVEFDSSVFLSRASFFRLVYIARYTAVFSGSKKIGP